jgi:ketosteroid isomerase-like protein
VGTPSVAQEQAAFQQAVRGQVTGYTQQWVNAWSRNRPDVLALYYTDHALVLSDAGAVHGRGAIEAWWRERVEREGSPAVRVGRVLSGPTLSVMLGTLTYRSGESGAGGAEESREFLTVFDRQREHWMVRVQAFAPVAAGFASGADPVRPDRGALLPPERLLVRLVAEGTGGRSPGIADRPGAPAWGVVGGGLGLELGQALELRGYAWQADGESAEGRLLGYGGEVRLYPFSVWRFWPHLTAGASWIAGDGSPDDAVIPVAGAGMGVEITPSVRLNLSARNHVLRTPEGVAMRWLDAPREQRWHFTGGFALAVGRRPVWRDPPLGSLQNDYEAEHRPAVGAAIQEWFDAAAAGDRARLEERYGPGAVLLLPGTEVLRSPSTVAAYWLGPGGALRGGGLSLSDVRISDSVALVTAGVGNAASATPPHQLITVLQNERGRWRIQAQVLGDGS